MIEPVKFAVTFEGTKNGERLTKFGGKLNTQIIDDFLPDISKVRAAKKILSANGFEFKSESDISLSVIGSRSNFEKLFHTKLEEWNLKPKSGIVSDDSFFYPPTGSSWSVDESLKDIIDDAYIQWPHIYMGSRFDSEGPCLFPPSVSYHHLRVPGDLALCLNATKVHRLGYTGKGVKVAMIDSGFDFSHTYFQESGYNTRVETASRASQKDTDTEGHGTAMSANLLAIAPGIEFIGIKLTNEGNKKLNATLKEGLEEAMKHDPDIISISLGSDLATTVCGQRIDDDHQSTLPNGLKPLEADIIKAVSKGKIIVCAAGNGHVSFPGMMKEVISVGGTHIGRNGAMTASNYASSFGSKIYTGRHVPDFTGLVGMSERDGRSIDGRYIMLPFQPGSIGERAISQFDFTDKKDGWGVLSGTSAAAPQIAGVCALLLEKNPGLTPDDLKTVLMRTSRNVNLGEGNPESNEGIALMANAENRNDPTGAGLVDAYSAFLEI